MLFSPATEASVEERAHQHYLCVGSLLRLIDGHRIRHLRGPGLPHHNLHLISLYQHLHRLPISAGIPSHTQARTFFLIYFPIYATILILLIISYFRAVFTPPGYTDPLHVLPPYPE